MILMTILGGKGTLWGPVIGATVFHLFKEGFWTYFIGWQYVALGLLIDVFVVFFSEGLMAVSYSVLTLPTIYPLYVTVAAGYIKNKV